ncbi:hypothetical protein CAP35_10280 [Chitinophagaceae bacterium IBVUCB1]|nr:hypothetical protein CAP35_10280 [Chitinophagaceae bacterium IBVUCB1]
MSDIKIVIKAFRAPDDKLSCHKFVDGHMKVLKIYGITMITSANVEWFEDPDTYVILVESEDGEKVYGGARVQVAGGRYQLPIEKAVKDMDTSVHDAVKDYATRGTAEFCGLWNSREVAGLGIGSMYLGRAAVAITEQLRLTTMFGLCAPATVKNSARVGFEIATFLGNNGTFYYPKEDLIATAVIINDTENLPTAETEEREIIFDLRKQPFQHKYETGPKGRTLDVVYDLKIPNL